MATTSGNFVSFLSRVPLFRHIAPQHLQQLALHIQECEYEPGRTILQQGNEGLGLFILIEGRVKVIRHAHDGARLEIDVLEPFDFFGELSLLDDAPITATIVSDAPSYCLVLDKKAFLQELRHTPDMALGMLRELASRHRRIVTKL
jgi:CRP/FNR family transcriptional regulator, cyclic AMP receptor protein